MRCYYARACKRPIYCVLLLCTYYILLYGTIQCIIPALALGKLRYAAGGPTLLIGFRFMRWRLITATFLAAYGYLNAGITRQREEVL